MTESNIANPKNATKLAPRVIPFKINSGTAMNNSIDKHLILNKQP